MDNFSSFGNLAPRVYSKPSVSRFKEQMNISNNDIYDLPFVLPALSHIDLRKQYQQGENLEQEKPAYFLPQAHHEMKSHKSTDELKTTIYSDSPLKTPTKRAPVVDLPYILPPLLHIQMPDHIAKHPSTRSSSIYKHQDHGEQEDSASEYGEEGNNASSIGSTEIAEIGDRKREPLTGLHINNNPHLLYTQSNTHFFVDTTNTMDSDVLAVTSLHLDLAEEKYAQLDHKSSDTSPELLRRQHAVKGKLKKLEEKEAEQLWKSIKKKLAAQKKEMKAEKKNKEAIGKRRKIFYKEHARFAQSEVQVKIEKCVKRVQSMCGIGPVDGNSWR